MAFMEEVVGLEVPMNPVRLTERELLDDLDADMAYWDLVRQNTDEAEMLVNVDRVTSLIRVETAAECEDVLDWGWSGMDEEDDEDEETILIKSKPRKGRPSKRELHPVRYRCLDFRNKHHDLKFDAMRRQVMQRIAEAKDLRQQVQDWRMVPPLKSVNASLPRDIQLDVNCPDRRFTITILPNGKMVYSFMKEECAASGRKYSVGMATSRHAHQVHPGTPTWARRPAR